MFKGVLVLPTYKLRCDHNMCESLNSYLVATLSIINRRVGWRLQMFFHFAVCVERRRSRERRFMRFQIVSPLKKIVVVVEFVRLGETARTRDLCGV